MYHQKIHSIVLAECEYLWHKMALLHKYVKRSMVFFLGGKKCLPAYRTKPERFVDLFP